MQLARLILSLMAVGGLASGVSGAIATFDSYPEGEMGTTFESGGILFYGLDGRWGDPAGTAHFDIDAAEGTLAGMPGFSAPNVLGLGGYSDGPGCAFARVGEVRFKLASGEPASAAQLDLFALQLDIPQPTVTLEAWRNGSMVGSTQTTLDVGLQHYRLSYSGAEFDELRFVSSGESNNGATFAVMDNVAITPEPAAGGLLATGLCLLRRRR